MIFSKNNLRKKRFFGLIFFLILILFLFLVAEGSKSPKVINATIFLHGKLFKSKYVLRGYILVIKLDKYLGENTSDSLPKEIDSYLLNTLRSDPSSKRIIIDSYIDVTSDLSECCDKLSTYEDKTLIGDVIEYAKPLDSRRKLAAIKLIEDLRTNSTKIVSNVLPFYFDEVEEAAARPHIQNIFNLYEKWWALSIPLDEKLKVDPLQGSMYKWTMKY